MKTSRLLPAILAAVLAVACSASVCAGDEPRALLHLHLDSAAEVAAAGARIVGAGTLVPGRMGQAYRAPGGDARVEVPAAGHVRADQGTVEAWVRADGAPNAQGSACIFDVLGTPNWWNRFVGAVEARPDALVAEFTIVPDREIAPQLHPSLHGICDGSRHGWVHYAATWSRVGPSASSSVMRLYVNGIEVDRWAKAAVPVTTLGDAIWIGSAAHPGARSEKPLPLLIDEFAIWDRALSPEDIFARSGRPAMQTPARSFARVRPRQVPITVDGAVDADEWDMAQSVGLFRQLKHAAGRLDPLATTAWVAYDEEALFIAWRCETTERTPAGEVRPRDGAVWTDDSVEVLLAPASQQPGVMLHTIGNAYGSLYDERLEGGNADPAWDAPWQYSACSTEGHWEGELRIGFSDLGLDAPREGERWGLNICRTSISPSSQSMWSHDARGFVHADGLGEIEFAPAGPTVSSQQMDDVAVGENVLALSVSNAAPEERRVDVGLFHGQGEATPGGSHGAVVQYALSADARGADAPLAFTIAHEGPHQASMVVRDAAGDLIYCQPFAFDALPALVVELAPDFPAQRLRVSVDASRVAGGPFVGTVQLAPPGGAPALREAALGRFEGQTEVVLSLGGIPAGDYRVVALLSNAEGREVASRSEPLAVVARPLCMDPDAGRAGVLPPWTPVKRSGSTIECWNRSYTFDGSPLPTRIVSNGGEVLAGPVQFSYRLPDGEAARLSPEHVEFLAATEASAPFVGTLADGRFHVVAHGHVDYDGAVIYNLTVTPERPVTVDAFDLEIPLHPDAARYLLDGWASRFSEEKNAVPQQPGGVLRTPYSPQFGLAGDTRGIQWFSESDEGWTPHDRPDAITLEREADCVVLRMTIKKGVVFEKPLRLSVGLMATPARPMPPPGSIPHVAHYWPGGPYWENDQYDYRIDLLDEFKRYGAEVVILHVYWARGFGNVEPVNPERFRMFMDRAHELDMRVIVYVGGLVHSGVPARGFFGDQWLVLPRTGFTSRPNERNDITSELVCSASETFQDWLAGGLKLLMENYGVDGFYYDWGVGGCRNGAHGCGYQVADGEVAQPRVGAEEHIVGIAVQDAGDPYSDRRRTHPVLAQRRLWRRLYGVVHEVKGDRGIVLAHCDEGGHGFYFIYSDLVWHSEDVACYLPPGTFPSLPQYRFLMSKKNLGLDGYLLSYERGFPTHHEALAISMLHGEAVIPQSEAVPTYLPERRFAPVKAVWHAWDAFGVDASEWSPYWSNARLVDAPAAEGIYVSMWRKPSAWLMVVSNLAQTPQDAHVRILDQSILPATGTDAISGEPLSVEADTLTVPLDGARMRLVLLRKKAAGEP